MPALQLALAAFLLATLAAGMVRIVLGPTRADSMLAAQLIGTTGVGILLLLAEAMSASALRDVALALALLGGRLRAPRPGRRRGRSAVSALDWACAALLVAGAFFFFAGTVGLLRFPDVHARLHALTKVDSLGLGLLVLGLALRADSAALAVKLALIWALAVVASASAAYLVANRARRKGA
jgi:multicomponent Na+:H+ antiporter subunit G